jgi:uncharacterized membrane protein (UPF0127 family)
VTRAPRVAVAVVCASLLVLVAACSTGSGSAAGVAATTRSTVSGTTVASVSSTGAPEGFTKVTLVVTRSDGSVEVHCVWLADTAVLRDKGLMGVTDPDLGGAGAMVFRFDPDSTVPFWMKDTVLPLSIAWIDASGSVIRTTDMAPCPADGTECPLYPAGRPYRLAIEMAQGRLDGWGLAAGSTVRLGSAC